MKKRYPKFKQGELETIFSKLPNQEQKIINDFVKYCAIGCAERKQKDIKRTVIQFRHIIEKPLNSITLKVLRDYLALLNSSGREKYTCNGIKTILKRFLKWKYKDWSKRFEELRDIKLASNPKNTKKINANTLPKKEELEKLFKEERNLFWKTFLICLYETGMRPKELRHLKWKDIEFRYKGEVSIIRFHATKNDKPRVSGVKIATPYLEQLREQQNNNNTTSQFVFPSNYKGKKGDPISRQLVNIWFTNLCKRVLGRHITPYFLRHKRAREIYIEKKGIKEDIGARFIGHSKSMRDIYENMSEEDIVDTICNSIYQTEDLPPKQKHKLEKEVERLNGEMKSMKERISKMVDEVIRQVKSSN